ncbi:hypothetical protein [Desulfitobacterium hafniense]|uniref:hypothetical protein n=1 Tax=Desulfitobacterium hafniense TaxID=49338 RepID=UPI00005409F8|nr:hypothetical protein [Desulfitobacterium hafniense]
MLAVEEIFKLAIAEWGAGRIEKETVRQLHEATLLKLDISKAEVYLNWHPVFSCREAIERTVAWYKRHYKEPSGNMFSFTVEQIRECECIVM